MEESVFVGSSEVSASSKLVCSKEVFHDSSEVEDSDNQLLCNNKTVVPSADCAEDATLTDTAAEVNDACEGMPTTTKNDSQHLDMGQPSVIGKVSVRQSDKEEMSDLSSLPVDHELELATKQTKQKFGAFHQLDHPASVVIDLRSPPLVQVCLLHGEDDIGAGGSGSGSSSSKVIHQRPQTARRGRRLHPGMTGRMTGAIRSDSEGVSLSDHPSDIPSSDGDALPSNHLVGDTGKKSGGNDEKSMAELSTIIRLKVVEAPTNLIRSGQSVLSPVTDNSASDPRVRISRDSEGGRSSESSDDDTMRVRNVNRTYSRNPSVPASQKNPPQIGVAKSTDHHDRKKATSRHTQGFKSVPEKPKKNRKQRIGPAWFSRRSLNAPPAEIWKCVRTTKALKTIKRPNYNSGVRRLPVVAVPPVVRQMVEVPVSEEGDIDAVGREELKLWRLSKEDVVELQSQLHQEAEHRRSEHIMPLVMQMTDAQIEHAYERVAESMKTYEIVEADSDEDEDMPDDDESEGEVVEADVDNDNLKSQDWNIGDEILAERIGKTEYSRSRPKRHAVDYGPSAFAPILIMEGRRVFSQRQKSSKESGIDSADMTDGAKLQQLSRGHKSRRQRRRKSKVTDDAEKSAGDMDDTTGRRVGLFDGLSQCRSDDGSPQEGETPLQTLPLLIPAKHVAVISSVRSSPPPDLGLPIAPDDGGPAANPNGPPVLEPELDGDAAAAAAVTTVAECATSLRSVPATVSDNGVIIIE